MKSVLLHVQDEPEFEARLQAALDIVRATGGHLSCLQATPSSAYVAFEGFGGILVMADMIQKIDDHRSEYRAKLETRLSREDVAWDVVDCTGDPAHLLVSRASLADLLVVSRAPGNGRRHLALTLLGDVLLGTSTPTLVMPETASRFDLAAPALIAWNSSVEAGNAVRAALPLLQRASVVHILCVEEDKDHDLPSTAAAEYLARHGIAAEVHNRSREGGIEQQLLDSAAQLRAGYLVMGAYGHSRAREYLFGGVTRALLQDAPLPLVLAH